MSGAMRVCIVAEHASKRLGGEAILPFHYFRILRSRGVDAWLIVHERTREELLELFPDDAGRMCFVKDQALQKLFFRVGRLLPARIAEATFGLLNQLLTQRAQRGIARSLATERSVIHQPIPVSPRFPSLLAGLRSPLIVGPLNGGMDFPAGFRGSESRFSRVLIAGGRSLTDFVHRLLPGKRRAAVVLVANARTREALPSGIGGAVITMSENGVDLAKWRASSVSAVGDGAGAFLFIGRLVEWKALDLAVEAVARVPDARLEVIGDGPMRAVWERLAEKQGLGRVRFHGWLAQAECAEHLQAACALVLPSLYECGGAVVLEAMAMRKPVIATAWGGPADYLDESCGILVEPCSRGDVVAGFAAAMGRLMHSPEECARLGENGRKRLVEHFDWEKKVDALMDIYHSVLPAEEVALEEAPQSVETGGGLMARMEVLAGLGSWEHGALRQGEQQIPEAGTAVPDAAEEAIGPAERLFAGDRRSYTEATVEAIDQAETLPLRMQEAEGAASAPSTLRIAYLLSQYPAVSHTFLLHEVLGLRARGMHLETASINRPDRLLEALPAMEAEESRKTRYIKGGSRLRSLGELLLAILAHPAALLRGLATILRLSGLTLRQRGFWLFYLAEALLVGRWMRERRLDHLHVHFGGAVASVGMLLSAAWRIPYSLTIHGPEELLNFDSYQLQAKVARAAFVVCISDFCRSQLLQLTAPELWGKFHVVRLGVDPAVLLPVVRSPWVRDGGCGGPLELVCTGRLVAAKGHVILLQALERLRQRGVAMHATLIGAGPERARLEAFVQTHRLGGSVTFTSALSHGETLDVVRKADIFALASFAEGIPVSLMEAMALGVPCVSTSIAGVPELIRSGVDGVLVAPSNVEALADALEVLALDPALRRRLGGAARERILSDYNLSRNQEGLAQCFETLVPADKGRELR